MEIILLPLIIFGAYRAWVRESFLGVKRKWLKMIIFGLLTPLSATLLTIEFILLRIFKSRGAK